MTYLIKKITNPISIDVEEGDVTDNKTFYLSSTDPVSWTNDKSRAFFFDSLKEARSIARRIEKRNSKDRTLIAVIKV